MSEKKIMEIYKFVEEYGYNNELKNIYLREILDQNKEYE